MLKRFGPYAAVAGVTLVVTLVIAHLLRPSCPGAGLRGLDAEVQQILKEYGNQLQASIWVGGPTGDAWYQWQASVPRPTASAIKTALLVEFFAAHQGHLEEDVPEIAQRPFRPPIVGFGVQQYELKLKEATANHLGQVMMGKIEAPNEEYNAAANLVLGALGGPEFATKRIHARDPAFAGIMVRRYMLEPTEGDENEATADALARVLQRLAARQVPGIDDATVAAIRGAFLTAENSPAGTHYFKGGDLYGDPLVVVRSGWWEIESLTIVCVVMTTQPNPGSYPREVAIGRQSEAAQYLTRRILEAARLEKGRIEGQ
jgi:hypothetical protein